MIYPAVPVPIGAVLFAVAMWRSGAVPPWATGLFVAWAVRREVADRTGGPADAVRADTVVP